MPKFACSINEIPANVEIRAVKTRQSNEELLKVETRIFMRRHRIRIPAFVHELLSQANFNFNPNYVVNKGVADNGGYRLDLNFDYDDIRDTTLQTFLKRLTRWRIVSTEIQACYRPVNLHFTFQVKIKVMKPSVIPFTTYVCEVRIS